MNLFESELIRLGSLVESRKLPISTTATAPIPTSEITLNEPPTRLPPSLGVVFDKVDDIYNLPAMAVRDDGDDDDNATIKRSVHCCDDLTITPPQQKDDNDGRQRRTTTTDDNDGRQRRTTLTMPTTTTKDNNEQ